MFGDANLQYGAVRSTVLEMCEEGEEERWSKLHKTQHGVRAAHLVCL